jgi:hypothetical protein
MKSILLTLIFLIPISIFAQKNSPYKQNSAEVKKNIWGNEDPIFKTKSIPEKFNKESAVIIARTFELDRTAGLKFKLTFGGVTGVGNSNKVSTFRERIKINDKAALDNYSTLEYDKIVSKSESYFYVRTKNTKEVYIGIKIVKPDGKEIILNSDEEVVLANNNKDKAGKIAVSGLQVGDIIDYYIYSVQQIQGYDLEETDNKYVFLLADEYPVLNYNYRFKYNKKLIVSYNSANNAPEFEVSTNADEDQIITLKGKDQPKYTKEIWYSPLREIPYITISSYFATKLLQTDAVKYERKNKNAAKLEAFIITYENQFNTAQIPYQDDALKLTKDHFKSNKNFKAVSLDSSMKYFYNTLKNDIFGNYTIGEQFDFIKWKKTTINSKTVTRMACKMLCDMEIPHDILLVSSRFSNRLEDSFEIEDYEAMIRINSAKPLFMNFENFFTSFNEIPTEFQGEKAIVLSPKRHSNYNFDFSRSETTIPVVTAENNKVLEIVGVDFSPEKMQEIKIHRTVKEIGAMKYSDQLNLLLFEDVRSELAKYLNGTDIYQTASAFKSKKSFANYNLAVDEAKRAMKENFITDITDQYDQKPKELVNYKILSNGVTSGNPLQFESTFTMETFVKKAGNNYILDIGKLIGQVVNIEPEQRNRQTNIYMPAARSLEYHITINIPAGFNVVGFNDLVVDKSNTAGSISVTTKLEGQQLTVNVSRVYSKIFLKKEEWNNVLVLLDGAKAFSEKKVLLEKTK